MNILAIDPGREKCGLAVLSDDGSVLARKICPTATLEPVVTDLAQQYSVAQLVLGNSTMSAAIRARLPVWLPGLPIILIDETKSTLEARALYWKQNPPRGWRRLLPISLQVPPVPVDDFAAVVLGERYFEERQA